MIKYALFENNRIVKLLDNEFDGSIVVNTNDIVDGFDGYQYLRSFVETEKYNELADIYNLRILRQEECFSVINRGQLWYSTLTEEQLAELQTWYKAWLDVTETKVIPEKLEWLK